MTLSHYNSRLFQFLEDSPTPFHAMVLLEKNFTEHGFIKLHEGKPWDLEKGTSYFVSRQQGAMIAFTLGEDENDVDGFRILTAHSDSPCLQIKPVPDMSTEGYSQLGVEVYGGSLLAPWFDRDLTLAGRVCCTLNDGSLAVFLVHFNRPLLTIPSVAIHLNREANNSHSINKQKDLPPVIGLLDGSDKNDIKDLLKNHIEKEFSGTSVDHIQAFDLFCIDTQKPSLLGLSDDFISASRLDNLLSAHSCMTAMIQADKSKNNMFYIANHEENGSMSAAGAQGSFISSVFERIVPDAEKRHIGYSNTFLISVDNAHATHPNASDTMDPAHNIELNKGVVIKCNANQRYTTNSLSSSIYKAICSAAGVETQEFVMRSDMPCGSTIGPLTAARLGVLAIDIGAPTLGMHSIRELTGSMDPEMLYKSLVQFLSTNVHKQLLHL
ncbi:MAG: aspartyl aminopeptidase [Desulforhopalus sp.]|jgi:aspartyl aminopeptidase